MIKLREENPNPALMSDKVILEKILGRSSVRLNGWGRDPLTSQRKGSITKKSKENRPSYDELVDEVQVLKGVVATLSQVLIDNNMLPPTSTPTGTSKDNASEFDEETESEDEGEDPNPDEN